LYAGLFGQLGSGGLALRPLHALSGAGGLGFGFLDGAITRISRPRR
jgi:hypothetical protein